VSLPQRLVSFSPQRHRATERGEKRERKKGGERGKERGEEERKGLSDYIYLTI
jgi:hypothetical protein